MLTFLIMTACASPEIEEIKPTRVWSEFTVKVEVLPVERIDKFCSKIGVPYKSDGCARITTDTKLCEIFVPEVNHMEDFRAFHVWGHEIMHCVYGLYHK